MQYMYVRKLYLGIRHCFGPCLSADTPVPAWSHVSDILQQTQTASWSSSECSMKKLIKSVDVESVYS